MLRRMVDAAPINPAMLRWAREKAGFTVDEVAARFKVRAETVERWEAGEAGVTFGRVDELSTLYKRPSAVLYLDAPPAEDDERFPTDFRSDNRDRTPGLIYQIRHAYERRELAIELMDEMGETTPPFTFKCTLDEDPEEVGDRLRRALGVAEPVEGWTGDRDGYAGLAARKRAAESAGVLVFQGPAADLGDASGFSLHFDVLPVMVLRASDVARRRSFTLLHELVHIGLRVGGLCDLHDEGVELFCNQAGAAALMGAGALRRAMTRLGIKRSPSQPQLAELAQAFSVSEQALMLRLVSLGNVSLDDYRAMHALFASRGKGAERKPGGKHQTVVLSRAGNRFAEIVVEAYHRGLITAHRAARSLDTNAESLESITEELARRALRRAS
jgi:Zn-dependent peptidase ImmA (M78 family)/transcriptional regulator with XRE-family HTH domain